MSHAKKNSSINGVIEKYIHKQPELQRMPEEIEELNYKSVITSNATAISALKAIITRKNKT